VRAVEPDDRRLAQRVGSGDEDAFRRLYRRHTPALYRMALRLGGGDSVWAEELVQRAWVRAVESLAGFGWRSAFSTWLCGIAANCARESWREGERRRELAWDESAAPDVAAEAVANSAEDRIDLERAIARLPEGCRQVFVLHDVEGFTHLEIGRLIGIEAGTSKSQLSYARRHLRAMLRPADSTVRLKEQT
jgi:RNA polymerase sigma-70 factor (ECF subfamily)